MNKKAPLQLPSFSSTPSSPPSPSMCFPSPKNEKRDHHPGLCGCQRAPKSHCISAIGVLVLVLAYTAMGSIIFMSLEGETDDGSLETAVAASKPYPRNDLVNPDIRSRTVDRLWSITEDLNILYKENWTRLAAQEVQHFQDTLLRAVRASKIQQPGAQPIITSHKWSYASAFLYSLTLITTIAAGPRNHPNFQNVLHSPIFSNRFQQNSGEGKTLLQVWKEFSILDCIRTVSSSCAEIKPSTLNACWRPLLPQMVQKGNDISSPLTEILNIASDLGPEGFADINHEDIEELLREESLNEEELVEFINESNSNALEDENTENELFSNFSYDLKKGLDLAKELERHLTQNDPSTIRSAKFKREFQNCLAPYKEVLGELQNKTTFKNQEENLQSEDDFRPIRKKRARLQIFDSDDE